MDFSTLSFPDAPLIKVSPPGPRSKEYLDYQSLHEGAAVSYPKGMPMAIRRAKGATLEDVDGNLYIDFFGGAAVIVEAVQGEGGSIVPPDEFLPKIREICGRHDVLMIVDEVQAGLGRTGKMFAFEHTGVIPDIVTLSKGLGGAGFPISCVAYRAKLDTWPQGKHIGTFRGNVIAYAAGSAALNFMVENSLTDHAVSLGNTMLSWLKEVEKESKIVGEARGKGLMLGAELVIEKDSKEPAPDLANRIRTFCHRHGLMIEIGGHYSNVARFLPPLVLTKELALKGIEIFEDAIKDTEKSM